MGFGTNYIVWEVVPFQTEGLRNRVTNIELSLPPTPNLRKCVLGAAENTVI